MSFSPAPEPTKLIFNFLSLIRRGSSYGPLGLYATVLVVLLPWWPSVHGAPLFRGCIILPLETRYFLPCPLLPFSLAPSQSLDPRLRQRATYGRVAAQLLDGDPSVPTWRINSRETNNPAPTATLTPRSTPRKLSDARYGLTDLGRFNYAQYSGG